MPLQTLKTSQQRVLSLSPSLDSGILLKMEPVASVIERIKGFGRSTEEFFSGAIRRCSNSSDRNPIEILKRLQREAFSDLMKLRERQDKVERMLAFYRSGKGGPFQEATTHMKGIVDVVGAFLFVENDDKLACDTLNGAGIRTGIDLRFIFETAVRQKDLVMAEFVSSQNSLVNSDSLHGIPLALAKVTYLANINDWLSVIATPLGACCSEYRIGSDSAQGQSLGRFSSFVPPLFSQYHGSGAGVMVKGSNISASIAELVSGIGMQPDAAGSRNLSTFGQVTYHLFEEARLTFSCLWQKHRAPSNIGLLALPLGFLKRHINSSSVTGKKAGDGITSRSIALMLDSEFDESTKLVGWIEMQKSSSNLLHWGVSLSDTPEDELGWGLRMGGMVEGHIKQFQLEGFLNINLGKACLQPGLVYAMDGRTRTPALVFRSNWCM